MEENIVAQSSGQRISSADDAILNFVGITFYYLGLSGGTSRSLTLSSNNCAFHLPNVDASIVQESQPIGSDLGTGSESLFFKKKGNKNLRKRPVTEEEGNNNGSTSTVIQKSKFGRKGEGGLEFSSQNPLSKEKQNQSEKKTFFYDTSRQIQTQTDSRATATLETETEFSKDARAIRERVLKQADESLKGKVSQDEKIYKGIHGYKDHKAGFRREHTIAGEKAGGAHGPLRASAHIRWSVRFDYQPDICKDYKETGYCGYGDACKFMHDRGDYKSGWQLDREWEENEKSRKSKLATGAQDDQNAEDEEDSDELPFACFICRQPFKEPVVTICKHYFCEHCALKHHARNKHCYVCNKPTNGTFNTAFEILKRAASEKDGSASSP